MALMNYRICRCCGEPMGERGNALSLNPSVCASCSSMADGMEETGGSGLADCPSAPFSRSLPVHHCISPKITRNLPPRFPLYELE
jgi:hypothetical protein